MGIEAFVLDATAGRKVCGSHLRYLGRGESDVRKVQRGELRRNKTDECRECCSSWTVAGLSLR